MALDPMSLDFLLDEVVVYPAVVTIDDDLGSVQTNGTGVTLTCSVQHVSATSEGPHRDTLGDVAHGLNYRIIYFTDDPGVTDVDQILDWTAHNGITFATPRRLVASKKQIDPGGLMTGFRVVCYEQS